MGFSSLRLVGEAIQNSVAARKTGYGSHDVLDQAVVYKDLTSALRGIDLSIGTTSKSRIKRYDSHTPSQLVDILNTKRDAVQHVGFVFGSEENGLSTNQLDQCDLISTIPLATHYPSLNLAQSVLIYCWELSKSENLITSEPGNIILQNLVKAQANDFLNTLKFDEKPILKQRLLDRMMLLGADDMELLLSVLNKLKRG